MHELIENHDKLNAQGVQVFGVFESDNVTLQDYLKEIPVPLIGDPKLVLYKKYGVEKSFCKTVSSVFNKKIKGNLKKGKELIKDKKIKRAGSFSLIPADFIIDENRIITTAYYGENVSDHLPLEQIIEK